MKRLFLRLGAVCGLSLLVLTGCATHRPVVVTPTGRIVVPKAPPPPKNEIVGTAPSPNQVWVPGYWAWSDNRYVWIAGHFETRPASTTSYVPGHWDQTPQGWVWTPGAWK